VRRQHQPRRADEGVGGQLRTAKGIDLFVPVVVADEAADPHAALADWRVLQAAVDAPRGVEEGEAQIDREIVQVSVERARGPGIATGYERRKVLVEQRAVDED